MCRFFQFVCVCTLQPILLCKQQQEGESAMAARKVELCGMDTSQLPVLSEAEKSRLIEAAHNGDQDARQQMIQGNLRLVLSVVQKFASRGENLDDLFQVGCIGLIKAIDNFDLSQITDETERINMIMVVQSYIEENFIKKNSTNPNKARKLIVSTDEAHRILKFEGARMFENALYRVARKRHTAPWLILQSVKDFAKYQDTEEILKSTETFMLFRHNYLDGQYIKDTTNLTQSQVDTVLNLGGTSEAKKYGELCLVDIPTKRAVFIQADYLKDSEFDVVETDVEKIAEHARMKQGA